MRSLTGSHNVECSNAGLINPPQSAKYCVGLFVPPPGHPPFVTPFTGAPPSPSLGLGAPRGHMYCTRLAVQGRCGCSHSMGALRLLDPKHSLGLHGVAWRHELAWHPQTAVCASGRDWQYLYPDGQSRASLGVCAGSWRSMGGHHQSLARQHGCFRAHPRHRVASSSVTGSAAPAAPEADSLNALKRRVGRADGAQ